MKITVSAFKCELGHRCMCYYPDPARAGHRILCPQCDADEVAALVKEAR